MTDPSWYNSPKRLLELWKELTGEDLTSDEIKTKEKARGEGQKQ